MKCIRCAGGELGPGADVDKVRAATRLLQSKRPDFQIDERPINDLSKTALMDDIVYTIALTAIQATQV
jgi:phosphate acetyltransferase